MALPEPFWGAFLDVWRIMAELEQQEAGQPGPARAPGAAMEESLLNSTRVRSA